MARKFMKNVPMSKIIEKGKEEGAYLLVNDNPRKRQEIPFHLDQPTTVQHLMSGKDLHVCI